MISGELEKLYREWSKEFHSLPKELQEQFSKPPWNQRPARLHPDLRDHVYDAEHFGAVLKHPLVFGVPYHARDNRRLNEALKWKRKVIADYTAKRKWDGFCAAHERPYRADALYQLEGGCIVSDFSDEEFWNTARFVWTDSENIFQNEDIWGEMFENRYETRHLFMSDESRKEWDMFPGDSTQITVYRGFCHDGREYGWSWTTDGTRAKFFAARFADREGRLGRVAEGKVYKGDVIGYVNDRDESEVVCDPNLVDSVRVFTVDEFTEYRREADKAAWEAVSTFKVAK